MCHFKWLMETELHLFYLWLGYVLKIKRTFGFRVHPQRKRLVWEFGQNPVWLIFLNESIYSFRGYKLSLIVPTYLLVIIIRFKRVLFVTGSLLKGSTAPKPTGPGPRNAIKDVRNNVYSEPMFGTCVKFGNIRAGSR